MAFGDFEWLCRNVPSYPTCNLFFRQLLHTSPPSLSTLFPTLSSTSLSNSSIEQAIETASVGVDPVCGLGRLGVGHGVGGTANVVLCAVAIPVVIAMVWATWRRNAAVGRLEFVLLLTFYLATLPFQLLTANGIFEQGSTALSVLTSIYLGFFVAFFCVLLANALVITQVVEDGTMAALVPTSILALAGFVLTTYISLDTAFGWSKTFGNVSGDPAHLHNLAIFVLTLVIPLAFSILWLAITLWIVLFRLRESKPALMFVAAFIVGIVGSALLFFFAGKPLCQASNGKVDGAFLATFLSTIGMAILFLCHKSITEASWDEDEGFY